MGQINTRNRFSLKEEFPRPSTCLRLLQSTFRAGSTEPTTKFFCFGCKGAVLLTVCTYNHILLKPLTRILQNIFLCQEAQNKSNFMPSGLIMETIICFISSRACAVYAQNQSLCRFYVLLNRLPLF